MIWQGIPRAGAIHSSGSLPARDTISVLMYLFPAAVRRCCSAARGDRGTAAERQVRDAYRVNFALVVTREIRIPCPLQVSNLAGLRPIPSGV
jgi:hypothetical protein